MFIYQKHPSLRVPAHVSVAFFSARDAGKINEKHHEKLMAKNIKKSILSFCCLVHHRSAFASTSVYISIHIYLASFFSNFFLKLIVRAHRILDLEFTQLSMFI